MNDDFLKGFREPPPPEFARSLYGQLARERQFALFTARRAQTMRVVIRALAAVALALGLTILVFPNVRVALAQFIRDIAGFPYKEIEQVPAGGTPVVPDKLTLSEARARMPQLVFGVPSWSPAGYILQEQVDYFADSSITLHWASEKTGGHIYLLIGYADKLSSDPLEIGPNGAQEVKVGSAPAVLEQGVWDGQTGKWDPDGGIALRWKRDGTYYFLFTSSKDVNADELIHMAESIP